MTAHELARQLRSMYVNAPPGHKTTMMQLFGIRFAAEMRNCGESPQRILDLANIGRTSPVTIHDGIRLAEYVVPKRSDRGTVQEG